MKKNILFLVASMAVLFSSAQFSLPYDSLRAHPMSRMSMNTIIGSNDQMVVFEYNGGIRLFCGLNQALDPNAAADDVIAPMTSNTFDVVGSIGGNFPHIAITSADINGDKKEEVIYAYSNGGNGISIVAYSFNVIQGQSMQVVYFGEYTTADGTRRNESADCPNCKSENGKIELHTVKLDRNSEREQVVMSYYNGIDNRVHHEFFGESALSGFMNIGSYTSPTTVDILTATSACALNVEPWDVAFDDFNLDSQHELVFIARPGVTTTLEDIEQSTLRVSEIIFSYSNGSVQVNEQSSLALAKPVSSTYHMVKPEVSTGDLNGDQIPEIVVVDSYGKLGTGAANCFNDDDRTALQIVQVGSEGASTNSIGALNPVIASPIYLSAISGASSLQNPVSAATPFRNSELKVADYDGDRMDDLILTDNFQTMVIPGSDSLLVGTGTTFETAINAALPYTSMVNSSFRTNKQHSITSVSDANADGTGEFFKLENRSAPESTQRLILKRAHFTSAGDPFVSEEWGIAQQPSQAGLICAMTSGDISGDGYELGKPLYYTINQIEQPIVVLSAPPLHSDYFVDSLYSVVDCLPNCSDWRTTYTSQTAINQTVSTEVHSSWNVGSTQEGTFSALYGLVKVKTKFEESYGENYSDLSTMTSSQIIASSQYSQFDDAILVTKTDYGVTEYPILKGGNVVSYTVSIQPLATTPTWTSSKSYDAYGYIPSHEVGNVLSYRRITTGPNLDPNDYTGPLSSVTPLDATTLSTSNAGGFVFTTVQGAETESTSSWDASISNSTNVDLFFRASVGVSGNYDWGGVSTHKSAVSSSLTIDSYTSSLPFNDMQYSLRPFIYFGAGGHTGVAFNASVAGNNNGFWSRYNMPDPAWNMPWRLDQERGLISSYSEDKYRTKSLWFTEYKETVSSESVQDLSANYRLSNPSPGDRVVVHARVFNHGLQETLPVPIKFYHGHPNLASGNTPLADLVSGFTSVECPPIPSQEYREVTFTIQLPENNGDGTWTERGPRLYAVIDPDNEITDEVHEENNIAWLSLGQSSIWGQVSDLTMVLNQPTSVEDVQKENGSDFVKVFPNPVSDMATVVLNLGDANQSALLSIADLSGRIVYTKNTNGNGREVIDLSGFANGFYLLTVSSNDVVHSAKILVDSGK